MGRSDEVVVIGGGLGGLRTIEQLRATGCGGAITLVGAEVHPPYDRPPLSKQVLAGEWTPEQTHLVGADRLEALGVTTRLGVAAVGLRDGVVELADGSELHADAIVVATGLVARRLPGQPEGVHTLRTLDDAGRLRAALEGARSLLVVGAGFIGAEVASVARSRGMDVTMLEALPVPFERTLGTAAGGLCARLLTENGVDLRCGVGLAGFEGSQAVRLTDGGICSADVVLVAIGATPELGWLAGAGIDTGHGLSCDSTGRVRGLTGVWAVGDIAAWEDPVTGTAQRSEHWTNASDQAAVVARDILGLEPGPPLLPYVWSDQFGTKIQLFGWPDRADSVEQLHGDGLTGGAVGGTVTGYFAGDLLVGVVGFGAAGRLVRYRAMPGTADRGSVLELAEALEKRAAQAAVPG